MQTEGYAGYGELMSNAMGVWGRRGTNIFIVLLQSGICCTYFIVACKLLQSTVCPKVGLNLHDLHKFTFAFLEPSRLAA